MERRAVLAALLIAALLILYQFLFIPSSPPPEAPPEPAREPPKAATPVTPPPSSPVPLRTAKPPAEVPSRRAAVEGPLYRASVSSEGGRLDEWVLHYRGEKPMVVPPMLGPPGLLVGRPGSGRQSLAFELSRDKLSLGPDQSGRELILRGHDRFGLRVSQTLRFEPGDFRVEVALRLENQHTVPQGFEVFLLWATRKEWPKEQAEQFQGQRPTRVVSLSGNQVRRVELDAVTESASEGQWVGLESEWYLAALVPRTPGLQLITAKGAEGTVEVGLKAVLPQLAPGQAWEGTVLYYLGPKEYDRLRALGVGLEEAIFFGGFPVPQGYGGLPMAWFGVPILWLMNFFYRYTGNYGLAIILLTVIVKILFYPLTLKSMGSMKAMQSLQPQVNALRAKYKSDPQRAQKEMMDLYKKEKVNPMGGCLPMVIQIPIFYALYITLSVSVELQNAALLCIGKAPKWIPWVGGVDLWICDLAQHDPTYILPLLMGASMFVQQKMTPTVGDPRQAKIMLMMPVVFTFMFLTLPSGLVLYWFVSNLLQILQQHYTDRRAAATKGAKGTKKDVKVGSR